MIAHRRPPDRGTPSCRPTRGEAGFTLLEIIVAIIVTAIVTVAAGQVVISTFQHTQRTVDHLSSSNSAFLTDARFGEDVASADRPADAALPSDWTSAVTTIGRGAAGCNNEASVLRILSPGPGASGVQIISYARVGGALVRRICSGATIAAAVAASPRTISAVPHLATTGTPVTVTCRATASGDATTNDSQCRIVSLSIVTSSGYRFTVTGVRTTADRPNGSPRVTHQCTLLASANANTYQDQPNRNFNDHDDFGGAGRTWIEDRGRPNWVIRGYLQFDLGSACQGTDQGEPGFMHTGQTLTSATLQLTYHDATVDGNTNRCNGQHELDVLNQAWDPTQLTWNSQVNLDLDLDGTTPIPSGHTSSRVASARIGFSTSATATDVPWTADVLAIVRHWYAGAPGPGVNDWANDGWVISSVTNSCDSVRSYKWMSKGSNDDDSPRLILAWSE